MSQPQPSLSLRTRRRIVQTAVTTSPFYQLVFDSSIHQQIVAWSVPQRASRRRYQLEDGYPLNDRRFDKDVLIDRFLVAPQFCIAIIVPICQGPLSILLYPALGFQYESG